MKDLEFRSEGMGMDAAKAIMDGYFPQNRVNWEKGNSFAFYKATDYDYATAMRSWITTKFGHNLMSAYCYGGTATLVDRALWQMGEEFFHCKDENRGGQIMCSGTIAVQHCLDIALKRFYQSKGHDYVACGHDTNLRPVVLAPYNITFIIERVLATCGLGARAVRYYSDAQTLKGAVRQIYQNGEEIILHYLVGGDTRTGMVQPVAERSGFANSFALDSAFRPLVLIDAAPHGFNLWAQDRSQEIDFSIPWVDILIVNPQKCQFPLGSSLIFYRDMRILNGNSELTSEARLNLLSHASWMVAKDASGALSFFGTLLARGTDWFRQAICPTSGGCLSFRTWNNRYGRITIKNIAPIGTAG